MITVPHVPVMLSEVLDALQPRDGEVYVDGTFGAGGYTQGILNTAHCQVIAIDRDETAITRASEMADDFDDRLIPMKGTFGDVENILQAMDQETVDGLVLDLGVSSMQIDQPLRGFSFQKDGPLDMRMDQSTGDPAHVLVNETDETALADIIYRYGDERHSRRIARAIVMARAEKQIETTLVLADIVAGVMPGGARKHKIHPATRTFQALRIAVNGELDQLEQVLDASLRVLKPGGRLVVVTFHSLEDAFVKTFFREKSGGKKSVSRHMPDIVDDVPVYFQQKVKKAIPASSEECAINPRARSAKLRWGIRTELQEAA